MNGILYESRHYAKTRKELSRRFPGSDIGPIQMIDFYPNKFVARHYGTKSELINRFPMVSVYPVHLGDKVCQNLTDIVDARTIKNKAIDASQCEYGDLYCQYFDALRWISFSLQKQFPDRPAQKLTFLDCGSRTGVCPNHGTHNGEPRCVDIQYYTYGENNYTQKGYPIQRIWDDDGNLILTVRDATIRSGFDVERNARLVLMLAEAFPSLTEKQPILMHSTIMTALDLASIASEAVIIEKATRAEDTPAYNHDKHFHVEIYGEVNKEMEL